MNDLSDQQLLRDYADHRDDAAFAELVRRHVDLVYSAARRMTGEEQFARDVTQAVFLALAQNADRLTGHPVLSGWLHCTARNLAAKSVRTEVRRRAREQEAAAMNELLHAEPDTIWEQVAPLLDDALGELTEPDRDALLLRYFERKSAREMAQTLGVSDEAAQKRVSRAVERVREFFAKHGVTVGGSGLVAVISANAVQAAPAGLALTISTAAVLAGTTVATAAKAIAMTTLQKTIFGAAFAAAIGTGIYEARQLSLVRAEAQAARTGHAEQILELQRERDEATNRLASLASENQQLMSSATELVRLRGEVGRLRAEGPRPVQTVAGGVTGRVVLSGTAPPETRIDLTRYPELAKQYPGGLMTRRYQVGTAGGLQNVLVSLRGDFGGKKFPPPATAATLNHGNGLFDPYVMGVRVGQPLALAQPSPCAYQADAKINKGFRFIGRDSHTFTEPEVGIRFRCDGHLWNFGYLGVFDHPFYAVTDKDGKYSIRDVPPGRYALEAWHPKAGAFARELIVTTGFESQPDILVEPK